MSQHDYDLSNASAAALRADLNNALQAAQTQNAGTSAPSTTFSNQFWYDVTNSLLMIRNHANSAWQTLRKRLGLETDDSPQFGGLNVGHDSDTTITRYAAGVLAVEGGVLAKENRANVFTSTQTVQVNGIASQRIESTNGASLAELLLYNSGGGANQKRVSLRVGSAGDFAIGRLNDAESSFTSWGAFDNSGNFTTSGAIRIAGGDASMQAATGTYIMLSSNAGYGSSGAHVKIGQSGDIDFFNTTTQRFNFNSSGQAYSSTGTWGTLSDERLKEHIEDARDYTDDLMGLRVRRYALKEQKAAGPTMLGLIAQEVQAVFPGLVDEIAIHRPEQLDDDGNVIPHTEPPETHLAIKTSVLLFMVLRSHQRLVQRVEELEANSPA